MGMLCYSLRQIPDLSLNKYQSLANTGVEGVLKLHEIFLRQWHGICTESNTSLHLLYVFMPSEPVSQQLKIFFLIRGDESALKLVEPLAEKSPLSDFFTLHKDDIPQIHLRFGSILTKKEQEANILNPMTGNYRTAHYVPKWETNASARQYDLFRIMETVCEAYNPKGPCAFRIDLYPVSLAQETRSAFNPILKTLRGENDLKLVRDTESLRSNDYAREICKEYEAWLSKIETTPHFRMNIYSFASTGFQTKVLLNAAGSEALDEGDFQTTQIKPDADGSFTLLSRIERAEDHCFYPNNQNALKSWSTTYSLSEVAPFFRFPTLYDGEAIGIPKETAPILVEEGIYLGKDTNGYPVNFPLKDLTRHAFFTGMPGSGKTNTMLHLISQLKKRQIPFLVLEPAKKEYRAMLGAEDMHDVHLFSPHMQSKFPLHVNPMEFPVGVRLSEHINALLEVFQGSFVLAGATYKFLSSSIQKSYTDLGWDIEDENTPDCELPYPTLQDVYNNLQDEIDASSYNSDFKGDLRAFLQVRLGGLMERDAGELFNAPFSTISPDDWVNKSAIVELEVLGEQAKNFFVLLVCHYILETLRANPSGGTDANGTPLPVRHVVFIEEAHNIIAPSTQQSSTDSVDPKISATAYIVKMLAEVRALREAIVIADQLPSALASEVTKNTGLKLVHRLISQEDRAQIGSAISASPLQLERMASFTCGQAYVYHEKTMRPFEMQVAEWSSPNVSFDYSNDAQLYANTWLYPAMTHSLTVSLNCWAEKHMYPVDDQVLDLMKRRLDALEKNNISELDRCKQEAATLLVKYLCLRNKLNRLKQLWLLPESTGHSLENIIKESQSYLDCRTNQVAGIVNADS